MESSCFCGLDEKEHGNPEHVSICLFTVSVHNSRYLERKQQKRGGTGQSLYLFVQAFVLPYLSFSEGFVQFIWKAWHASLNKNLSRFHTFRIAIPVGYQFIKYLRAFVLFWKVGVSDLGRMESIQTVGQIERFSANGYEGPALILQNICSFEIHT